MGCGGSKSVSSVKEPTKVHPASIQDKISVECATAEKLVESHRIGRKVKIEIIRPEQIVADTEVAHLGQLAAPPNEKKKKKDGDKKKKKKGEEEEAEDEAGDAEDEKPKKNKEGKKKVKSKDKQSGDEDNDNDDEGQADGSDDDDKKNKGKKGALKYKDSAKKPLAQQDPSPEELAQREQARYRHILDKYPQYEFIRKQGDGSFGEVILVRERDSGQEITLYV